MDRRAVASLGAGAFTALAGVLMQVPGPSSMMRHMPWWQSAADAAVLFGLMLWHSWCYARWTPHSPNRMLINEFATRTWFVLFGLLVVGAHGDAAPIYLVMASAWGVASWCTHYLILRSQGEYRTLENLAQHGLFLLGLALIGLITVRLGLGL